MKGGINGKEMTRSVMTGSIVLKDYWEAGTTLLFTVAEWLESRQATRLANTISFPPSSLSSAERRCMQATALMSSLVNIVTQKALLATTEAVDADEVIDVKSGEIIPVNGIVVEGNCEVDEKTLMEESFPEAKQIDSNVWAGTTNHSGELNNFVFLLPRDTLNEGYVTVKTTALAEDRVVARMAKLVEETQNNKSKTQKLME
ncbi:hypothetical protein RJ639_008894 [Escallonia herrerae]|uniref:P-type ATPase A domain-containing protein n=1 Tax=Escallonia herrerae TaxID=1293975 RepID=A0AA88VRJ9_9ASTE|nr:hypothetical protein RJ639_008894 [Escallonia herrerae]